MINLLNVSGLVMIWLIMITTQEYSSVSLVLLDMDSYCGVGV